MGDGDLQKKYCDKVRPINVGEQTAVLIIHNMFAIPNFILGCRTMSGGNGPTADAVNKYADLLQPITPTLERIRCQNI